MSSVRDVRRPRGGTEPVLARSAHDGLSQRVIVKWFRRRWASLLARARGLSGRCVLVDMALQVSAVVPTLSESPPWHASDARFSPSRQPPHPWLSLRSPNATPAGGNTIVTAAGSGTRGSGGDGWQASEAQLNQPRSIFPTPDGGFVWAEPYANDVRKVGPDGVVTVVAGTGAAGFSGDGGPGDARDPEFRPRGGADTRRGLPHRRPRQRPDSKGLRERRHHDRCRNRRSFYWGDSGRATDGGDQRPTRSRPAPGRQLPHRRHGQPAHPQGLRRTASSRRSREPASRGSLATADGRHPLSSPSLRGRPTADGGLLIVDVGNQRIRKVSPDGIITTVAGNGRAGLLRRRRTGDRRRASTPRTTSSPSPTAGS